MNDAPTNLTTKFREQDGYLLVTVTGPWTEETARRVIDGARTEATTRGCQRLLLDLTQWNQPTAAGVRFSSGEYLARVLRPPLKIAAFAHPEFITRLGENTAVNRGAWYRIFADEQSAVQWLLAGTEPQA